MLLFFEKEGFEALYVARSFVRLELVLVQLIIMAVVVKMNVLKMLTNILPSVIAASLMLLILLFPSSESIFIQLLYVVICVCIYFAVILLFPEERSICFKLKKMLKRK